MQTGIVTPVDGVKIRKNHPSGTQIGTLREGDTVEAAYVEDGWWRLTSISRNGSSVSLPGPVCWVDGRFIREIVTPPPPPPPSDEIIIDMVTVHFSDGSAQDFEPVQ